MTIKLSKHQAARQWLSRAKIDQWMTCPYCQASLRLTDQGVACQGGHHFDLAKQGYLFLSRQALKPTKYDRDLFLARRSIIRESPFYRALHEQILICMEGLTEGVRVLDAGGGEGSHLATLMATMNQSIWAMNLDLSKEGIQLATDYNDLLISVVSDLAHLPLANQSIDLILNILSPSNYGEFDRVLVPGGRLIKVIPGPHYLAEIRQSASELGLANDKVHDQAPVLEVFKHHYPDYQAYPVQRRLKLSTGQKADLLAMTPLAWSYDDQQRHAVLDHLSDEFLLDLLVLVGTKASDPDS